MNRVQGSHLIGKDVKQIPREKPREKVDQTNINANIDVVPEEMVDLSTKQVKDNAEGVNNKTYGIAGDLFNDAMKSGPSVYGGRDAIYGKGILGPGLENFPEQKVGFEVPGPKPSYEVVRREKLKPKIDKDIICDCCDEEVEVANEVQRSIGKNLVFGLTKSHQFGYKATERGVHGMDYAINDATFRDNDKVGRDYIDPNQSANQFKYGYQRKVVDDAFGQPMENLDGIARVSLKSGDVTAQKAVRARGARDGGKSISGRNRVGFRGF